MKCLIRIVTISMILSTMVIIPSYAQCYGCDDSSSSTHKNTQQNQVQLTNKGTIKVGFYTDPGKPNTANQTKFNISFVNKDSSIIQQHIDYKISIKKGTDQIFGIPITHTAQGSVTVPFQFTDTGAYQVVVEVDGILFQPITPETATFTVDIMSATVPEFPFTVPILLIGITSLILVYRIRIIK